MFGKQADPAEEETKSTKREKNKSKAEADGLFGLEGLTGDEKMAVELYQVFKKSKSNEDLEDDEELDDVGLDPTEEDPVNDDIEDENTYNH